MLVAAFEVQVGARQLGALLHHRLPADARVEPHVEDVGLAPEGAAATLRAAEAGRDELFDRALEPGVGTLAREDCGDVLAERLADVLLPAPFAENGDDRDAPVALAGEAPVRPRGDHVVDPVAAPPGDPAHALDP